MRCLYQLGSIALAVLNYAFAQTTPVTSANFPQGLLKAPELVNEEKGYCEETKIRSDCHKDFWAHLVWRELRITPSGTVAFLVEDKNEFYCGSAGCSLYLFLKRPDGSFAQILGDGDIGGLNQVKVLKSIKNNYYDLQKTERDGKTQEIYRWKDSSYVVQR